MTYTCEFCGRPHLTKEEALRCPCQGAGSTCTECCGTGKKIGFIGPAIDCPACNGSGRRY